MEKETANCKTIKLKEISTQLLTVLITGDITYHEQKKALRKIIKKKNQNIEQGGIQL